MGYIEKLQDSLSFRGNIPGLVTSSLISGTAWQMYELVWQPYILSLGGSMPVIGSLEGLWILLTSGLQFITGEVCDASGRKKAINGYYVVSIIGLIISIYAKNWRWLILPVILYSIADSLSEPSVPPIFAESIDKKKVGVALSLLSLTWFLPGLYSKIFAGYIGDNIGITTTIWLVLLGEILAFTVFFSTVKETLKERRKINLSSIIENFRNIFKPRKELRSFYALAILDRFAWALNIGIFVAMIYESFNFSLLEIGALMTIATATTTMALIPTGKLVDRYGSARFLQASVILSLIAFSGYLFVKDFILFAVLQVFRGLAIAFWDPAYNSLLTKTAPDTERGTLYGNINGLIGFITFPAPLIGAFLFNYHGFTGTFGISILVGIAALALAYKMNNHARN